MVWMDGRMLLNHAKTSQLMLMKLVNVVAYAPE